MRKIAFLSVSLLFSATLGLSSCGFTPMHSPQALSLNGTSPLENISINMESGKDTNDKEVGFFLLQRLRDRIGTNDGIYTLTITPAWRRANLGVSTDDVASRYDGSVSAKYKLTEKKSGAILDTGSISAVSTFAASRDPYGVITANDNALRTTASEAADRIIIELAAYFSENKTVPAPE